MPGSIAQRLAKHRYRRRGVYSGIAYHEPAENRLVLQLTFVGLLKQDKKCHVGQLTVLGVPPEVASIDPKKLGVLSGFPETASEN